MRKGRKGRSRRDNVDRSVCLVHDTWGQEEEEEERSRGPLRKTPMLQQQVADFKKDIRRIKKYAVPEEQEWVL